MKRTLLYLSSLVFVLAFLNANASEASATDPVYTLVWSDEFDVNGAPDPSKWHHQTFAPNAGSWYNNEEQHYTDRLDNSVVENGVLKIIAKKETFNNGQSTKSYTSARLNSKYAFTYGRVDVRAKMPTGDGTWPAIWTLGKNISEPGGYWETQGFGTTAWPATGEIDIMEHWGDDPNVIHGSTHTPSSFGATLNTATTTVTDATEFHEYSIEWDGDEIRYFVDDTPYYTYDPAVRNSDTWPFDEEQYLLLNVAMGGIYQGGATQIDPSFTESAMEIDYVRVYEDLAMVAPGDELFSETFDAATSVDGWIAVADATLGDEASFNWSDEGGATGGALEVSGYQDGDPNAARSYIWEEFLADGAALGTLTATEVEFSVDLKIGDVALNNSNIEVIWELEGSGSNVMDIDESMLNNSGYTTFTLTDMVDKADPAWLKVNVRIATVSAVSGEGANLLVDNITLSEAGGGAADPVALPIDFESATANYTFGDFEGGASTVIANPQSGGINTSATVAQLVKGAGAVFAGTTLSLDENIDWGTNNAIKAKVYSPRSDAVLTFKLESAGGDGGDREVVLGPTTANAWEEITFDFTGNTGSDFNAITLIWDNGTAGDGSANWTFLIDDIELTTVGGAGGGDELFAETFDAATSVDGWIAVADATLGDEASFNWSDEGGATGGALEVSGFQDGDPNAARSYLWEEFLADGAALGTLTATEVEFSVDLKIGDVALNNANIEVIWELEGSGSNVMDIDESMLNNSGYTTFTLTDMVDKADPAWLKVNVRIATVSAVSGEGANLLVDNITLSDAGGGAADPVALPIDFESATANYTFGDFEGGASTVIANPQSGGINTSATVAQLVKGAGAVFAGTTLSLDENIDWGTNNAIKAKVYSPRSDAVLTFKLESAGGDGGDREVVLGPTTANAWEEITFDFTGNTGSDFNAITLIWDNGTAGDGSANWTFLIDDIELTTVGGAGGGDELFAETFDAATSVDGWIAVADATLGDEASFNWSDEGGATGGALEVSGFQDGDPNAARSYLWEEFLADGAALGTLTATEVEFSVDLKIGDVALNNANIEVIWELEGSGSNVIDVDESMLNNAGYATFTMTDMVDKADPAWLKVNVRIATVSAVSGEGANLLVDNITLSGSGGSSGDQVVPPIDFESATATYTFNDFEGGASTVIDNPQSGGINTSAKVAQLVKGAGAVFAGTTLSLDGNVDWGSNNAVKVKIFSPRSDALLTFKFESAGGDAGDREVVMGPTTANAWEEVEFNFTGNTGSDFNAITLIWDNGTAGDGGANWTFLIDDIELAEASTTIPEPTEAAPTPPARNAADVISFYSDAYTDIPGVNYSADFDEANLEEVMIEGNNTLKYTLLPNFFAFDFSGNKIDASAMTEFHMDFWTPSDITNKAVALKFVDFGGGGAESSVFELTVTQTANGDIPALQTGTWVSIDLPISAFSGNTTRSDLAQFLVTFASNNIIYIDNVYFWKEPTAAGKDATLSNVQVDGTTIEGFSPAVTSYNIAVAEGTTTVPTVTFTLNDPNASAVQTDATEIPGTTQIVVTSEDATVMETYEINFVNPVALPLDFETEDQTFGTFNGASFALAADPEDAGNQVGQITNAGVDFEGIALGLDEPVDFTAGGQEITMQFNTSVANVPVLIKFEGGADGAPNVEVVATATSTSWQELSFDFATANGNTVNATGAYSTIVVFAAFNETTSGIFYIDDIAQSAGAPSDDASLSDIKVDDVSIDGFATETLQYAVELPFGTTDVPVVTATTTDANASAAVTAATELPGTTSILVTAEDGTTTQTYEVNFTVALNSDASLSAITVDGEALANFDAATLTYDVELPAGTTTVPTVAATATDANATIAITDATEIPGTTTILVTAEDGSTQQTYSIEFFAPDEDDATLRDLQVDEETIDGFDPDVLMYSYEVPFGTTEVPTVTATPLSSNASAVVTAATELPGTTSILVTAQDGVSTLTYSVAFTVADPSMDASLSDLQVDGSSVSGFASGTLDYDVELPFGTTTVPTVTATATDANATVAVTAASALPGTTSVLVTAEDGTTTSTYTIDFTVGLNDDASLSDLQVDGTTVANFNATTLSYDVELPGGTTTVPTVTATATDGNATVVVTAATAIPGTTTVEVTADNGTTTQTYSVVFSLAPSNDATLSDLQVSGATVAGFAAGTFSYDVVLEAGTTTVPTVTATATDANATVEITDATSFPGSTSVLVTAEDGTTQRNYSINFTVEEALGLEDQVLSIYPNPSTETLSIKLSNDLNASLVSLRVVDLNGGLLPIVVEKTGNELTMDVSALSGGVYFIQLSADGVQSTIRFIKK